jgi:hypothetical protein
MTNAFSTLLYKIVPLYKGRNPSGLSSYMVGIRNYTVSNCYMNATMNNVFSFGGKLKVVLGSIGLAGHFEYGGKTWGPNDFKRKPLDSHAWLEDDEGNVYDFIFPDYYDNARYWGKTPTFQAPWEILGISKADLAEEGLEYIPANHASRRIIKEAAVKMYRSLKDPDLKVPIAMLEAI